METSEQLKMTVKVRLLKQEIKGLLAFCSVNVGGVLALNDIAIRTGKNGIFVSLPARKDEKAKDAKYAYREYFHPVTADFRTVFNTLVLEAYEKEKGGAL